MFFSEYRDGYPVIDAGASLSAQVHQLLKYCEDRDLLEKLLVKLRIYKGINRTVDEVLTAEAPYLSSNIYSSHPSHA